MTGLAEKAVAANPTSISFHGATGVLTGGAEPGVVNAMKMPRTLFQRLPVMLSTKTDPVYTILTGQTAGAGSTPTDACGDWPTPGNLKVCQQHYTFGRQGEDSKVIDITTLGETYNRTDMYDQELIGDPFANNNDMPVKAVSPREWLRSQVAKNLLEMQVDYTRRYAGKLWTGNPANTSASNGYKEYKGLQTIINTGTRDTETNALCAAADPLVIDFASATVEANGSSIVNYIVESYSYMEDLASDVGLADVTWALVMRGSLFRKLAQIWPCVYSTYLCSPVGDQASVNIDAASMVRDRDDMIRGRYLLINGTRVQVIIDDTLPEAVANGSAVSDIYLLPMTSPSFTDTNGKITFLEAFNFNNPYGALNDPAVRALGGLSGVQTLGNGRFITWQKANTNNCIQFTILERPRVIVRAPFLAVRITNVKYTWTFHEREWDPNANYYFVNGGRYIDSAPYFYP